MFETIRQYLSHQGIKYIMSEKAGSRYDEMLALKTLGQSARREFQTLLERFSEHIIPFERQRVSNWANQAQVLRPHFWCYFQRPEDQTDDVGIALRLYGTSEDCGISVEVSFVERQKSEATLLKQAKVLDIAIVEPCYYWVQQAGESYKVEGTEHNRHLLKAEVAKGTVRKVLVKYDVPLSPQISLDNLIHELVIGFHLLLPYYQVTKEQPL